MTLRLMASISRRKAFAGAAATTALLAAPAIVRAQAKALKIGLLLPASAAPSKPFASSAAITSSSFI